VFRLLLVEGDQTIGGVLESSLRMHGYQVAWMSTGHGALAEADRAQFDLVLLDLGLPDLDGSRCAGGCAPRRPRRCW
jgi:DNA-binding response OmpR family regulator